MTKQAHSRKAQFQRPCGGKLVPICYARYVSQTQLAKAVLEPFRKAFRVCSVAHERGMQDEERAARRHDSTSAAESAQARGEHDDQRTAAAAQGRRAGGRTQARGLEYT